jgi:hypothetical protein
MSFICHELFRFLVQVNYDIVSETYLSNEDSCNLVRFQSKFALINRLILISCPLTIDVRYLVLTVSNDFLQHTVFSLLLTNFIIQFSDEPFQVVIIYLSVFNLLLFGSNCFVSCVLKRLMLFI